MPGAGVPPTEVPALTAPPEPGPDTALDDVVNAYRAFLGRNPEGEAVIAANLRRSPAAMAAVLVRSNEFRAKLRDIAADRLTSHATLTREELEEALAWARRRDLVPPDTEAASGGASPATLFAALLVAPPVRDVLADSPDDVRAALAHFAATPPEHIALHRLTRPATEADREVLDLILFGTTEGAAGEAPAAPGQPLHRLIATRIGHHGFQAEVLRPLIATAPLPAFGLAQAEAERCADWLEHRLGVAPGERLVLGALPAALLRAPAVDDLVRRIWPAEHTAAMGALPALAAGAHQLQALRVTTEDVALAYLAVLGRPAEAAAVRRAHEGAPLSAMLSTLLASGEFRAHVLARLAGAGEAIPHQGLTGEQRRAVAQWLATRIGAPGRSGVPAPLHPMALLARLLLLPALDGELARVHGPLWAEARTALRAWLAERRQGLVGAIDYVTGDWIAGWALDPGGAAPLDIEVHCNGRLVAVGRADRPRPGATEEEDGYGADCGFRLPWRGRSGARDAAAQGLRFQILAARSGEPVGAAFQLDSVFVEPRSTLQMLTLELAQARATLDRLERLLPQLESFTGFPPEEHAAFRRAHRVPPPPADGPVTDTDAPPIRVVLPGRGVSVRGLRRILEALRRQEGPRWDAVLLAATPEQAALGEAAAARDPRITLVAVPPEPPEAELAAERATVTGVAPGALVLLLPPGAMPATEHALAWFSHAAARFPDSPGFFCDEDSVTEEIRDRRDRHAAPVLRTALDHWSLPAANGCGAILCARAGALAAALHAARHARDRAAQRWIAWAVLARAGAVAHIPRLLVSRQVGEAAEEPVEPADPVATRAALRPLLRHPWLLPGTEPEPDTASRISVIIPTRNGGALLADCLASLREKAAAPDLLELIVVDNGSDGAATLAILAEEAARGVRVLRRPEPFNWSRLNNGAAREAAGEHLLFLNDDTRMLTGGWDRVLRRLLAESAVGAVGARLVYEDLTLQHAGVVLGVEALAAHEGVGAAMDAPGPGGRWQALRAAGAVTGAFLACRRAVFARLEGFEEHAFGVTFNDVDFCLRLRAAGLAVLYAPGIALVHYESKSRGIDDQDAAKQERAEFERRLLVQRWGASVLVDPGFNPHWSRWARPFAALREPSAAEIAEHLAVSAAADPWRLPAPAGSGGSAGDGSRPRRP
ncbi:MAG: glycosyltransferase family 2 protein [Acetobacteraceae bacterium]|nr:glycosyltransferase family 2 protein [Acetobacteraceae bacterium]